MKVKQEIPWFKKDYLKKEWLKRKSSHYVFYFFKNTLAEKDIDQIIELKEKHYDKILEFLNLKKDQIIKYYFYPSLKEKVDLMGDDSPGNAIWEDFELIDKKAITSKFEIHTIYNNKCKFIGEHEDTHLLSLPFGLSIYLFCEGLAQFMEGNLFGKDIDVIAKELLNEGKLYSIIDLVDNKNWAEVEPKIIYPEVGSFVRFLINTYGLNRFKEVYQRLLRLNSYEENLKIINQGFGKSIKKIEDDWEKHLETRLSY